MRSSALRPASRSSATAIPSPSSTRPDLTRASSGRGHRRRRGRAPQPRQGLCRQAKRVLSVAGLTRLPKVHDVSPSTLHRGEVLGIGGLVGAGRSELVAPDLWRRPRRCRHDDAGGQGLSRREDAGPGRQGRARAGAGGAPRRRPAPDQERRLQSADSPIS